jgi:hypothetical protein
MLARGDFDNDAGFMAYCAWRAIENRRDELTPSSMKPNAKRRVTWLQWFRDRYASHLDAVRERIQREMDQ